MDTQWNFQNSIINFLSFEHCYNFNKSRTYLQDNALMVERWGIAYTNITLKKMKMNCIWVCANFKNWFGLINVDFPLLIINFISCTSRNVLDGKKNGRGDYQIAMQTMNLSVSAFLPDNEILTIFERASFATRS